MMTLALILCAIGIFAGLVWFSHKMLPTIPQKADTDFSQIDY